MFALETTLQQEERPRAGVTVPVSPARHHMGWVTSRPAQTSPKTPSVPVGPWTCSSSRGFLSPNLFSLGGKRDLPLSTGLEGHANQPDSARFVRSCLMQNLLLKYITYPANRWGAEEEKVGGGG